MVSENTSELEHDVDQRIVERVCNLTHQSIYAHSRLIREIGGTPGLRDESILNSAISAPFATFYNEDLHPTIFDKAGALMRSISLDHPFVDGNKRVSLTMTAAFLFEHGFALKDSLGDDGIVEFCLSIARGERTVEEIANWLRNNTDRASARSFKKIMEQLHDTASA